MGRDDLEARERMHIYLLTEITEKVPGQQHLRLRETNEVDIYLEMEAYWGFWRMPQDGLRTEDPWRELLWSLSWHVQNQHSRNPSRWTCLSLPSSGFAR
jgi:hypothetical protein